MIQYAILDEHGCIELAGITDFPPVGHIPLSTKFPLWSVEYLMFKDGEWQERPALDDPVITAGGFTLTNCPPGTRGAVFDKLTGVYFGEVLEENGVIEIELPDPGTYSVEIETPKPWIKPEPFTLTIEESTDAADPSQ